MVISPDWSISDIITLVILVFTTGGAFAYLKADNNKAKEDGKKLKERMDTFESSEKEENKEIKTTLTDDIKEVKEQLVEGIKEVKEEIVEVRYRAEKDKETINNHTTALETTHLKIATLEREFLSLREDTKSSMMSIQSDIKSVENNSNRQALVLESANGQIKNLTTLSETVIDLLRRNNNNNKES